VRVGLTGLLKIELPDHTVLLTDGGVTEWNGDTYSAYDEVLGSLAAVDTISEGVGQEIPALELQFAAPGPVSVAALSSGAIQQSTVRLWIAEFDVDTGEVVGTPELRFIGFVDQPQVAFAYRQFTVTITAVPQLELLFFRDTGNGLSSTFHKSLYPGELGHDNASGLSVPVAWGAQSPPRGGTVFGGGGSFFGSNVLNGFQVNVQ
jgi:hypothetical protein